MADENAEVENAEEGEKKGKSKTLLFIIIGAILLVLITAGVTFFVVSSMMPDTGDNAEQTAEAAEEQAPAEPDVPAIYVEIAPEFINSYQVGTRQRFLQVRVHVMTRKESVSEALTFHNPALRNEIIKTLGQQDFKALRTKEGREQLQKDIETAVINLMEKEAGLDEGIEKVLLTDFVMQ